MEGRVRPGDRIASSPINRRAIAISQHRGKMGMLCRCRWGPNAPLLAELRFSMYPAHEYGGPAMTPEEAKIILQAAVSQLVDNDLATFGASIGERPIMFRIAHYMASDGERNGLKVDCDYNRYGDGIKMAVFPHKDEVDAGDGSRQSTRFFPDILLHERRSQEHNVIACEIKLERDRRNPDIDRCRLQMLTDQANDFRYRLGAFILIDQDKRSATITYMENGRLAGSWSRRARDGDA